MKPYGSSKTANRLVTKLDAAECEKIYRVSLVVRRIPESRTLTYIPPVCNEKHSLVRCSGLKRRNRPCEAAISYRDYSPYFFLVGGVNDSSTYRTASSWVWSLPLSCASSTASKISLKEGPGVKPMLISSSPVSSREGRTCSGGVSARNRRTNS